MKEFTLDFLALFGATVICFCVCILGYLLFDYLRSKYKRWKRLREKKRIAKLRANAALSLDCLVVVWDEGDDYYHICIDAGENLAHGFNAAEFVPFDYKLPLKGFTMKQAQELSNQ